MQVVATPSATTGCWIIRVEFPSSFRFISLLATRSAAPWTEIRNFDCSRVILTVTVVILLCGTQPPHCFHRCSSDRWGFSWTRNVSVWRFLFLIYMILRISEWFLSWAKKSIVLPGGYTHCRLFIPSHAELSICPSPHGSQAARQKSDPLFNEDETARNNTLQQI